MKVLLFLFGLLAFSQAATICPAYHCVDNLGNKFRDAPPSFHFCSGKLNVVRQNEDNSVDGYDLHWVASCPNNGAMKMMCDMDSIERNTQQALCYTPMETTSSGANKYPGQKCHQDTQCVGLGTCQDGHCLGRAQGGDCRTSDDCSVGTYCKDKVCENLLAEGMSCNGSGQCIQYTDCNRGICTKLLSLTNGTQTDDRKYCASYRVEDGKCAEALKLINNGRVGEIAQTGVCRYETVSGVASSQVQGSQCGMAEVPSAYCPIGTGDDAFNRVLAGAWNYVNSNYTDCHINEGITCSEAKNHNLRGYSALNDLQNFAEIYIDMMDNPDCVRWNINYNNYFTYTGEYPQEPKDLADNTGTFSREVDITEYSLDEDKMTIFGRIATE